MQRVLDYQFMKSDHLIKTWEKPNYSKSPKKIRNCFRDFKRKRVLTMLKCIANKWQLERSGLETWASTSPFTLEVILLLVKEVTRCRMPDRFETNIDHRPYHNYIGNQRLISKPMIEKDKAPKETHLVMKIQILYLQRHLYNQMDPPSRTKYSLNANELLTQEHFEFKS